jgi:hypothetical protein
MPLFPTVVHRHRVRGLHLSPCQCRPRAAGGSVCMEYQSGANCSSRDIEVRLRSSSPLVTEEGRPRWRTISLKMSIHVGVRGSWVSSVATVRSPKIGFRHPLVDVHQLDICIEPLAGSSRACYNAQSKAANKTWKERLTYWSRGGEAVKLLSEARCQSRQIERD